MNYNIYLKVEEINKNEIRKKTCPLIYKNQMSNNIFDQLNDCLRIDLDLLYN